MQIVDGLLRIKRIRESAREQDVLRERRALDAATEALERAVEHRRRRDEARQTQEQQMVARLCAGPVKVREIEWTRVDIDGLRQEADKDRTEEEGVRARREEARDVLRAAQQVHRAAVRASEKFQLLADRERESRLEAMERQADLELEEFRVRAPESELEAAA
ncbi:MAG: YscO family type III secretion system apparatus protein [Xanthomonadales bacterium]|uniref:type III secretion system stalk subunit SctO n=1 Tax=Hydrogenophaga sp. TaxID=1904254 RepID=UPI001692C08A|nr:YscO family type III secretion system apparatus protein [Hydrogenophaga sp.]NIQ36748.1 YscO family type III secretion system apparatus protein [Xanthomonadales bacterium]NIM42016.1 YscO family type III secretion system apparatus protein [Hydrogenophaga sp.]NIN27319.1 YscO family type III secretion system apparatus protein [Hydrogenophaga sp.]NIN32020.1 YscO family type III secretion system apparatus protein [Hydrogenophaga sp.]NIN56172.1 YscO family type III secretion system apparatus prote